MREEDIVSDTYVASAVIYYTAFVYMAELEVLSKVAVSDLWYVQNKAVLSGKITLAILGVLFLLQFYVKQE